jgi:hypothetical protein
MLGFFLRNLHKHKKVDVLETKFLEVQSQFFLFHEFLKFSYILQMELDFCVVCTNEFLERRTMCVQVFIPFGDNSKSTSHEHGKVICIGSILPSFFVIKFYVNKPQSCTL